MAPLTRPFSTLALLVLLLAISACGARQQQPDRIAFSPEELPQSIAVVPVHIAPDLKGDRDQLVQRQLEQGRQTLDRLLPEMLGAPPGVQFIDALVPAAARDERSHLAAAADAARRLEIEAVLVVTLHRYQERQGSPYAVAHPASAAFDYRLLLSEDQRVLCSGRFDRTQQALTENILDFFKRSRRKFRWVTVEELTREGLREKLAECPPLMADR